MAVLAAGLVVLATVAILTFQRGYVGGLEGVCQCVASVISAHGRPSGARQTTGHYPPTTTNTHDVCHTPPQPPQAEAAAGARGAGPGEVHPLPGRSVVIRIDDG